MTVQQSDIKFPQEQQIIKLVEDTAARIEQFQDLLKKEYNRGPELRPAPPDKWNNPDSPANRIEFLNKTIENHKMYALKRTFEIAETLPQARQTQVINHAFEKLAPEILQKETERNIEASLTGRFNESTEKDKPQPQKDTVDDVPKNNVGKKVFMSRFVSAEKVEPYREQAKDQIEKGDRQGGRKLNELKPYVSRFVSAEILNMAEQKTKKKTPQKPKEKEGPDFEPEK